MTWGLLNLLLLVLYLGLMVYVGIISERGQKQDSASGYLLADRSATLPWIIMSVFATGVGTLAYIGTVGMIARGGVIDLWFEWFWCVGTPLMTLLFVRKMRTSGIVSFLDSLTFRYGARTLALYLCFVVLVVPFSFATMLKGAGLTFTDMFPVIRDVEAWNIPPLSIGAIAVLVTIALYLAVGGFRACLVTDMLQGVLTWAAMIVPTVGVILILGDGSWTAGWDAMIGVFHSHDAQNYLELSTVVGPGAPDATYSYSYLGSMVVMNLLIIMLPGQFYGSRYMAASTERVARQGPILALILTTVPYGLLVNITGLSFKAYAWDINDDDLFTGVLKRLAEHEGFPMILSSLLLIALLAAVMGTLDSYLMAKMTDFVRGIYQPWINRNATDKQVVRASRTILLVLVGVAIVASFALPDSIWFLQIAATAITGPIAFVLIVSAYLIRRSTWQAAVWGGGVASGLALFFTAARSGFHGQFEWMVIDALQSHWPAWLHSQFFTYPIGIVVFFVVNRFYAPQRPEHLERFFTPRQTREYVSKYRFDRSYLLVPRGEEVPPDLDVVVYADERRAYAPEDVLRRLAEERAWKHMPPYEPFESWRQVFDDKIRGVYEMGLEVPRAFAAQEIGADERRSARIVGTALVLSSMVLYLAMFWYFPLRWGISLALYGVASAVLWTGFCIHYEDYEWTRRLIDRIEPRARRARDPASATGTRENASR